jgi:hypothetical protein
MISHLRRRGRKEHFYLNDTTAIKLHSERDLDDEDQQAFLLGSGLLDATWFSAVQRVVERLSRFKGRIFPRD